MTGFDFGAAESGAILDLARRVLTKLFDPNRSGIAYGSLAMGEVRDPQHWLELAAKTKARADTLSSAGSRKAWKLVEEFVEIAYLVADEKVGRSR